MSVEAIGWALAQPIDKSSTKFVLVAMANCANNEGLCWPSMAYLENATSQDRKTVLANMARLKLGGYIEDTGQRMGITKQVAVYQLNQPENGTVQPSQKRNPLKAETVPFFRGKGPVFPAKQSQKRDTEPSGTVIEPSVVGARASRSPADRGSRLPEDWTLPAEWRTWAAEQRPDLKPGAVAEVFADYWHAQPGAKGRKADWFATWRTWVRNQRAGNDSHGSRKDLLSVWDGAI